MAMLDNQKPEISNQKPEEFLKGLTIGVFRGGVSAERDISLLSGKAVLEALGGKGYKVVDVDLRTKDETEIITIIKDNSIDLIFIALHGEFGEDGGLQKILEKHSIPFTGAGSYASFVAMDKIRTLEILEENNIPHPEYWIEDEGLPLFSVGDFPLVVKPNYSGSSLGVSIVKDKSQLKQAIDLAKGYSPRVIVERFIKGRELTVGIAVNKILPVVEIKFKRDFFDFFCKYEDNITQFIVPAQIPLEVYNDIQKLAYRVYEVLGSRHFSRVDLRMDREFNPYILELNSIPGLTSHSLVPLAAKNMGLSFNDLCEEIIKEAANSFYPEGDLDEKVEQKKS
jgi:D-alanine-D-alanine ligase